ncbi:protein-tyrosine phosphatase-like protein [Mortierella sp. GBAus27b]|nr:protein-tyrosine phosphatase-like protein [Mortierella sp. GBAus27b]
MSSTSNLSPPILTTSLATPTSPSLPTLPLPCSPPLESSLAISAQIYPSPSSSPSFGPAVITSRASGIASPEKSDATPFPASSISSAGLVRLLEESKQGSVSAGSRRPLILDLRPHPEFYPVSIRTSVNINLPTLLMRRYRRGGAVSSFALESFITMPSDMDMYHQIQDSWATAAWTLLNVLERGIGSHCFGGAPIRLWYLEGGFEAFQAWDASEEYLVRPGSSPSTESPAQDKDVEMTAAPPDEEENDSEQEISCILPNFLYLGPEIVNEAQVAELDRLGVKRILNMATECEDLLVANRQGMEYHKIGVYDHIDADVSAGLLQAVDIIAASSDSPIYVHCKAGKSRSVTATIAYLITQLHWPLNKAYQHVLKQRPCMCPNIGFVTELMRVEEKTLGKVTGLYA